jgi:hypothetical protein
MAKFQPGRSRNAYEGAKQQCSSREQDAEIGLATQPREQPEGLESSEPVGKCRRRQMRDAEQQNKPAVYDKNRSGASVTVLWPIL